MTFINFQREITPKYIDKRYVLGVCTSTDDALYFYDVS